MMCATEASSVQSFRTLPRAQDGRAAKAVQVPSGWIGPFTTVQPPHALGAPAV